MQGGGQPSHRPNDADFDITNEPGGYADIISYWTDGWPDKRCEFCHSAFDAATMALGRLIMRFRSSAGTLAAR